MPAPAVNTSHVLAWNLRTTEMLDNTRRHAVVGADFAGQEVVLHCTSETTARTLLRLLDGGCSTSAEIRTVGVEEVRTTSLDAFFS